MFFVLQVFSFAAIAVFGIWIGSVIFLLSFLILSRHLRRTFSKQEMQIRQSMDALEAKVVSRTLELEYALESLKSTQQALTENSKFAALGEMAGGIAHEINNPLTIISMASSHVRGQAETQHVDSLGLLRADDRIQAGVKRISKIVRGLRGYSRDSSEDPKVSESVSLIVQDTLSFCRERFKSSGVNLLVAEHPPSFQIQCRPAEISQVLLNLLNNAHDAACESSQSDRWVKIDVEQKGAQIQVAVSNNGPRIQRSVATRIFDPFFTTKPIGHGTGLGLSISKEIAQAHGGFLYLDLEREQTTFVLQIPAECIEAVSSPILASGTR